MPIFLLIGESFTNQSQYIHESVYSTWFTWDLCSVDKAHVDEKNSQKKWKNKERTISTSVFYLGTI